MPKDYCRYRLIGNMFLLDHRREDSILMMLTVDGKKKTNADSGWKEKKQKGIVFTSSRTSRERIMMTRMVFMSADEILFMT